VFIYYIITILRDVVTGSRKSEWNNVEQIEYNSSPRSLNGSFVLLPSLLHLYILRVRSSLWGVHFKKNTQFILAPDVYTVENFPRCCSTYTFRQWCECMSVYIWETETFIWFRRRNGKSLPPWRASGAGKYLTRNFVLLFFCLLLLLLRLLLQLQQLYCYYSSSHSDNEGGTTPFSTNIYKVRFFSFMGLGWYTVGEEIDVRVDRAVDCHGEAYRLFPRIILRQVFTTAAGGR